jgi:hypothetical protein
MWKNQTWNAWIQTVEAWGHPQIIIADMNRRIFPEVADLLLKLRQMMDNVLIHRPCPRREVQEGRRFEIIAGDHGFSASFELVLWTDPERYSDLLQTRILVLLLDWSI